MKNTPFFFLLLSLLFTSEVTAQYAAKTHIAFDKLELASPMEIPLILAGNFGEMRGNHFHTGLDIKTKGVIGQKVLAIEEGYVSRVRVSPWGYGNAIYISHPNGLTSLYAHLSKFPPAIDSLIYAQQAKNQAYVVDEIVLPDSFYVKKGELVAYSGNSGSSYAPHLHFEVRETVTEHALNPLLFKCYQQKIKDTTVPRITGIKIYAVTDKGYLIPGKSIYYSCSTQGEKLVVNNGKPIDVSALYTENSKLAFGFHTTDKLDAAGNVCGVHHTYFKKDETTLQEQQIDYINFDHNRFINTHQDYIEFKQNKKNIHKHFTTVVNPLGIYPKNNGKIDWQKAAGNYNFKAIDAHGNEQTVSFSLAAVNGKAAANPYNGNKRYLYPDSVNVYLQDDFQVLMEQATFYEPLELIYRVDAESKYLSAIYQFCEYSVPVQYYYDVRLKTDFKKSNFPTDKLGIGLISDRGYFSFLGGNFVDGWVEARTRSFGRFTLVVDSIAPVIKPLDFNEGKVISKYNTLELAIEDNLSGVAVYKAFLNNAWVLMRYNRKKKRYIIPLDEHSRYLLKKGDNKVEITATDRKNNTISATYTVIY